MTTRLTILPLLVLAASTAQTRPSSPMISRCTLEMARCASSTRPSLSQRA